jgi:hypothetical protein
MHREGFLLYIFLSRITHSKKVAPNGDPRAFAPAKRWKSMSYADDDLAVRPGFLYSIDSLKPYIGVPDL